jgi:hypothetical protein
VYDFPLEVHPLETFLPIENSPLEKPPAKNSPPPGNVYILHNNKFYVLKMGKFYDLKTFPLGLCGVVLYSKA